MTTKNNICTYKTVIENPQSTVIAEYTSQYSVQNKNHQSEAELEKDFINQLKSQGYQYLSITSEDDLIKNLRQQLEKLNNITFSDPEWNHFFTQEIANQNQGIQEKSRTIQEDYIKLLTRDDGSKKNICLLDKKDIHNNTLQVINQYATDAGQRSNRYDVTILVNGLPLVHIELKRRGVALQEAFNQINRYQRESFWASTGLFEYAQLFVISNGTHTKYYSNTTRHAHIQENEKAKSRQSKKTSNSFEFTNWWADANNTVIANLEDFTKTFFVKHSLLNILIKYCIFTTEELLLVMRPYQIVATERIINKIEISTNHKKTATTDAGGYIWHTTGSGKTLTSFKTAQLACKLEYVDKVLFVVDRKDLDYQTMKEYDKFEKNAANSNTSTKVLKQQLENSDSKIIITTIQKLDRFIKINNGHPVFNKHMVLIFDECHRSQFGDMHKAIIKNFKKYHLFGFTGTPILAQNSSSGGNPNLKTTEQAFGDKLHTYTIVDAIADKNVLPFKIDYISTMKEAENIEDKKVDDIDREKALADSQRLSNIVTYIREHFDQKTKRNSSYELKQKRLAGFNSIFAVSSINMAKLYYSEFQKQLEDVPNDEKLKVATIFSYAPNEEEPDGTIDENSDDTSGLDQPSRDFLEGAIKDYNNMFSTSFDTSSDKFQNYYKDVSQRVKNREIDILIVVNMFLTGFDATTLNTLWVDKNLRHHGLLQAFSRTNRILNSVKTFGNIVCFRNLEQATNESITLFGNKDAIGIALLKSFNDYYHGYTDKENRKQRSYVDIITELQEKFPLGKRIESEEAKKEFIKLYGAILRFRNILTAFDEFEGKEILNERELQDYHSMYIDLYEEFRKDTKATEENINDDLVFEMELIKQVEITIDYILELVKKYQESTTKDKERLTISKAIDSSIELRNKKDLIEQFLTRLDSISDVDSVWQEFVNKKKIEELNEIIETEGLKRDETYEFVEKSFDIREIKDTGTGLSNILPDGLSRFEDNEEYQNKCISVYETLLQFFNKYYDISNRDFAK